jgi:hypothetical protein
MKTIYNKLTIFALLSVVFSMALSVAAQRQPYRVTDAQVQTVIVRIETRTDTFKRQVERFQSRNNSEFRDQFAGYVNDFETATDALSTNFTSRSSTASNVEEVLNRAAVIDQFMRNNRMNANAQTEWNLIRSDLNVLAGYYRVSWNWDRVPNNPTNPTYPTNSTNTPYRVTNNQVLVVINRLEAGTDNFRRQIERVYRFRANDSQLKDQIISYVNDFENSTDNLKTSFTSRRSSTSDVEEVLNRAALIENFMRNNRDAARAQTQWNALRTDLDTLASYYRVSWNWNRVPTFPTTPTNPNYPRGFDARLTGTYRLNKSQSDDVTAAIDKALANSTFDATRSERIRRNLERRLTSPETFVIEKSGQQIIMASSNSPQVTFNADGVSRTETNPNGRRVQIRAAATNSDLTIDYEGDRMNDFNVSFMPRENGQLRVTRRLYLENQNETITVTSIYDKTEQVARWDGIEYQNNNPNNNYPVNGNVNNDFIVANNTRLTATLDTPLSTRKYADGDRFSMTVTSPGQYQGAVIEGRVNGQKSGVVSGRANLSMDFETIRLRNGSTYRFAGIVDQVREPDGSAVSVNNEGTIRDSNQTKKTVTRAGIGAALGAIIGAIAGGGSGAAIGAGVGAGAGAGSVILQGRDNLELPTGTEFTLTATAPYNR